MRTERLIELCLRHRSALLVDAERMGAKQLQDLRVALRGRAVLLLCSGSVLRKGLELGHHRHPEVGLNRLGAAIHWGNAGLVFAAQGTSLEDLRRILGKRRRPAFVLPGEVSRVGVTLAAGFTCLGPSHEHLFHALGIGTRLVASKIEVTQDHPILKVGRRVESSQAALLRALHIMPVQRGLEVRFGFQGGLVSRPAALVDGAALARRIRHGGQTLAALNRELGLPEPPPLDRAFGRAIWNVAALLEGAGPGFADIMLARQAVREMAAAEATAGVWAPEGPPRPQSLQHAELPEGSVAALEPLEERDAGPPSS